MKKIDNHLQGEKLMERILVLTEEDTVASDRKIDKLLNPFKRKVDFMRIIQAARPCILEMNLDRKTIAQLKIKVKLFAVEELAL